MTIVRFIVLLCIVLLCIVLLCIVLLGIVLFGRIRQYTSSTRFSEGSSDDDTHTVE
jgi:uncharacterized membrane protein affecting hemolysin expression